MKFRFSRVWGTLLYLLGWSPIFGLHILALKQTAALTWPNAVLYSASYLLPAILLGCVWRIVAARLSWPDWRAPRILATEVVAAALFVALWHTLFFAYLLIVAGPETARGVFTQAIGWQLIHGLMLYGLHAAAFHGTRIFGDLKAQEVAAARAEALRVRAEMAALRGQLDPHFLFNSLHSITALVREDPLRAEDALLQFAALLRRVLAIKRDSIDEVTLADEMTFVDDYLAIERLRLGNRLRVTTDIAPSAQECRLPAFSVQPLVENAIRHAIAPRREGGSVTIRARIHNERLEILVRDDGPGAEPAAVAQATGAGLSVIRQRLRLRHGDDAQLTTDTAPGRGFGATIALPAETEGGAT